MHPTLNLRPVLSPESMQARPTLRFQILAVEVMEGKTPTFDIGDREALVLDASFPEIDENVHPMRRATETCEVFVFGVSQAGHSVVARVAGFMPHFYVELSRVVTIDVIKKAVGEIRRKYGLPQSAIRVALEDRRRAYGWVPAPDHSGGCYSAAGLSIPLRCRCDADLWSRYADPRGCAKGVGCR